MTVTQKKPIATGVKRSTVCINITIRSVTMDLATVI